jgi:hypothetical protein
MGISGPVIQKSGPFGCIFNEMYLISMFDPRPGCPQIEVSGGAWVGDKKSQAADGPGLASKTGYSAGAEVGDIFIFQHFVIIKLFNS